MGIMANIICKTVGIAGMSAIVYDAYSVSKARSKRASQQASADSFEKIIADTRTTSTESPMTNAMQKKVAKMRMNNPLVSAAGSVKGAVGGFISSLGDNIIPAGLASLALAGKGVWAKIGAWGTAAYGAIMILREGFGVTKHSPMDN